MLNRFLAAALLTAALAVPAQAQDRRVPSSAAELRLSYAPIVQRAQPAVVNVYAAKTVQNRNPLLDDPIFRRFFGVPGNKQPEQMQRSLGSGVMVDRFRPRRHQQPRHRGRRPGEDLARRQARVRGRDRAEGQPHRPRGAAPQGRQGKIPHARLRQFRRAPGRRHRARDRQSLRRRPDRDPRHHLGAGAHAGRHHRLPVLHPDRCRDQSRQFRRRAGRHDRQACRHQHRDLLALRRLAGHRLCDPGQHGARGGGLRQGRRQGGEAAVARRAAAGGDARNRRDARPAGAVRARWSPMSRPAARRRGQG